MSLSYTFKSLAAFLFVLFWGWELSAVPSYPRPIRVEQPDGTTMTVRLYGDERFNYVTTVDGYNLVAENGVLYYAQVQGTKLVSTGVQAHDPMNRTNEERRILSSVSFGYPHGVAAGRCGQRRGFRSFSRAGGRFASPDDGGRYEYEGGVQVARDTRFVQRQGFQHKQSAGCVRPDAQ